MTRDEFKEITSRGLLILDGAMGSNLYAAGMPKGVSTEGWALEHANVVEKLQRAYVDAGSQVLYAPTFGGNRASLSKYGLDSNMEEINERLVAITQRAAQGMAYIAGNMAPTGIFLDPEDDGGAGDRIFEIYREQAKVLCGAGVDLFAIETMLSLAETEIALDAVRSVCDLPVMCTLTYQPSGRSYYGDECSEVSSMLEELGADAVGLNCSAGPDELENVVRSISSAVSSVPVIAKPNAGLPQILPDGKAVYKMSPEEYARHMKHLVEAGASVIGGCCGTTPEYIKKLRLMKEGKMII